MFSPTEIELAQRMHREGLAWTPAPGDYVLDVGGVVEKPSPFQDGVFFILNHDYFMTLLGGPAAFAREMVWLPTWEQARKILFDAQVAAAAVSSRLAEDNAIELGTERETLYRMILEHHTPHG